ncbi:hypothetical protein SB816_00140 [Achromobacter sp. SIMBA_011]|uniref:hypothetical protein n=1 Tax=Achromobacter TaxID=222 RepID=UPI00142F05FE|nr:hypothetical protein [Achromobacter dolens]MBQ2647839.1 hypothetical protein [Achromobacter sp.]
MTKIDVNFPNQIWMEKEWIPIIPPVLPIQPGAGAVGGQQAIGSPENRFFPDSLLRR